MVSNQIYQKFCCDITIWQLVHCQGQIFLDVVRHYRTPLSTLANVSLPTRSSASNQSMRQYSLWLLASLHELAILTDDDAVIRDSGIREPDNWRRVHAFDVLERIFHDVRRPATHFCPCPLCSSISGIYFERA